MGGEYVRVPSDSKIKMEKPCPLVLHTNFSIIFPKLPRIVE
jgi:hypothetical protein